MDERKSGNVMGNRREVLVILRGGPTAESLVQVCAGCRVQQSASARVGVVECPSGGLSEWSARPGVTVVTGGGDLPPGALEGLDDGEALFVTAWMSRNQEAPGKQRRGEGLSWDAPGFSPPDPPGNPAESHGENQIDDEGRDINGG